MILRENSSELRKSLSKFNISSRNEQNKLGGPAETSLRLPDSI